jgi:hypothetical protein
MVNLNELNPIVLDQKYSVLAIPQMVSTMLGKKIVLDMQRCKFIEIVD